MTDEQLDALEVAAKKMIETSCGPFASFYNEDFSKVILDLIAELQQAQELCGEHNQYIAELERTIKRYDNFVKSLAESLCIEHEEGWMPELDLIRAQVQLLKEATCSRKD